MATLLKNMVRSGDPMPQPGTAVVNVEPVAPAPGDNEYDAEGRRSRDATASHIFEQHIKGLRARRNRDLISEKLLLHVDGSGDNQWADIFENAQVTIPRYVSEYRKTENLLRQVVDHAVANHTTMPLRYFVDSSPDRKARETALVDMVWANYLAEVQDFRGVFTEALYQAMSMGFCPTHGYWRDDAAQDWFESFYADAGAEQLMQLIGRGPGMIDVFAGNPWDTVFAKAARRGSTGWVSYGRLMDGTLFRSFFNHIPEAANLTGSTRIPSAAEFQRIARDWQMQGLSVHGSPVIENAPDDTQDLVAVIAREIAPGYAPDFPDGRLQIIAVPGNVDTRRGIGNASQAVLVADQKLPGGDYSWENFYSDHRGTDIHGKPWVEALDEAQVDLNIALSKRWEYINKMLNAPIITPGGAIGEDMADLGGYNMIEVEPTLANWRPGVMQWPEGLVNALSAEIEDKRRSIYTGGGYQASSRGEAPGSRTAYRAILALQQADNTIHGPVNERYRRSACNFMGRCHSQMRRYADAPWLVTIVGDEYSYLVDPFIDRTRLSDKPPRYKLVNAFGASPELRAQEVLELMQTRGADGQPFLRTDEARKQYPNTTIFDDNGDPKAVMRRRAKTVAKAFENEARQYREATGLQDGQLNSPNVQQAAMAIFQKMEVMYPRLRDDDLEAHLASYSEVIQDETADPIARLSLMQRQALYFQWQAQWAANAARNQQQAQPQPAPGAPERRGGSLNERNVAAEAQRGGSQSEGMMVSSTAR